MGLTIHYQLCCDTRSDRKVRQVVGELRKRALDLPFAEVGEVAELEGDQLRPQKLRRQRPLAVARRAGGAARRGRRRVPSGSAHAVMAFTTWPGEGCEAANFGLAIYPKTLYLRDEVRRKTRKLETGLKGWCWSSFCKTQYARAAAGGVDHFLRCHLCVVRMLDHAKQLGILASVNDEGEFWEKRDVKALAQEVGRVERKDGRAGRAAQGLVRRRLRGPITQFPDFEHLEAKGRKHEQT